MLCLPPCHRAGAVRENLHQLQWMKKTGNPATGNPEAGYADFG